MVKHELYSSAAWLVQDLLNKIYDQASTVTHQLTMYVNLIQRRVLLVCIVCLVEESHKLEIRAGIHV